MMKKPCRRTTYLALFVGVVAGIVAAASQGALAANSVAPVAAGSSGSGQELRNLAELQQEILAKAIELAEFADKIKDDPARDELYRCVMEYDPDDKDARKALGYSKSKGEWVFKKYKEPKSRAKDEDVAELARLRTAAAEDLEYKLDECFPQDQPSVRHREALLGELEKLVLLDTGNELLRARAMQAFDEQRGEWRMREVVDAKLARAALRGFFKTADASVPVGTRASTDDGGKATAIDFVSTIECPRVLVSSTGMPEEAQFILQIVHQAPDFLTEAFGIADPFANQRIRIYDLADQGLRTQFYSKHPEVNGDREQLAQVGSSGFGRLCVCVASNDPKSRFDMAASQRVGFYLDSVFKCDLDRGWVRAGLGLYLSHHLCGTRLSLWIQRDEYGESDGPKLGDRLKDPEVDWLEEARILMRRSERPINLVAIVGKPAKTLTAEDLVISHALGAYLFEGRRADLVEILKRIGKGETPVVVFESQLGLTMDGLRARLVDWLGEMRRG